VATLHHGCLAAYIASHYAWAATRAGELVTSIFPSGCVDLEFKGEVKNIAPKCVLFKRKGSPIVFLNVTET